MNESKLPIEDLEKILGADWSNIREARNRSIIKRRELAEKLSEFSRTESSIVVFGSLARNEFTDESDIDWTLLIDGRADAEHYALKHGISEIIAASSKKPVGAQGTFGDMAFSHDILHRIGGEDDTNRNTTRRILLLLEATSIGKDDALSRVMSQVLQRYVTEDWGLFNKVYIVPRFLLNDIVRYWRTICVDFAYKRRIGQGAGWALRTIKLRLSRKLIYASGLLACYSFELHEKLKKELEGTDSTPARCRIMIANLCSIMQLAPLDILSKAVIDKPSLHAATRQIMASYDEFLSMLADEEVRSHLEELKPKETNDDKTYLRAREIGHSFQEGLDKLFLEENGTSLFKLTRMYGVF